MVREREIEQPLGFYLLSNYIGQPLEEIHRHIPYFNEKLLLSVERTLKRFKPDEPFERTSWSMVDDRNLFWRKSYRFRSKRVLNVSVDNIFTTKKLSDQVHPKDMWLRMDHQTFRKLPRSNGIMFGV